MSNNPTLTCPKKKHSEINVSYINPRIHINLGNMSFSTSAQSGPNLLWCEWIFGGVGPLIFALFLFMVTDIQTGNWRFNWFEKLWWQLLRMWWRDSYSHISGFLSLVFQGNPLTYSTFILALWVKADCLGWLTSFPLSSERFLFSLEVVITKIHIHLNHQSFL